MKGHSNQMSVSYIVYHGSLMMEDYLSYKERAFVLCSKKCNSLLYICYLKGADMMDVFGVTAHDLP